MRGLTVLTLFALISTCLGFFFIARPKKAIACENKQLRFWCGAGYVINIKYAYYGRTSPRVCIPADRRQIGDCRCRRDVTKKVKWACNGRKDCSIWATNKVLGPDPCRGIYKYLEIGYTCLRGNKCNPNPCKNGGACRLVGIWFACTCKNGFTGKTCETAPHPKPLPPPLGPGKTVFACENNVLRFWCKVGFVIKVTGANYGRTIPDPKRCPFNGGKHKNRCDCVRDAKAKVGAKCNGRKDCSIGATNGIFGDPCVGTYKYLEVTFICIKAPSKCDTKPCQNGGTCKNVGTNDFSCTCRPGFTGKRCETDIDECAPKPCLNGGTCIDRVNGFKCNCADGFTGNRCETDIDECASHPCLNGGTCIDRVNGFKCNCVADVTGTTCDTIIDDCDPNPCRNGGTCNDGVNDFDCDCRPGYKGKRCQIPTCDDFPCPKGKKCAIVKGRPTCVTVVDPIKAGKCPCPHKVTITGCDVPCKNDHDCPCKQKCCLNEAYRHVCSEPEH